MKSTLRRSHSLLDIGARSLRLEEEIKASKEFVETVFNNLHCFDDYVETV